MNNPTSEENNLEKKLDNPEYYINRELSWVRLTPEYWRRHVTSGIPSLRELNLSPSAAATSTSFS
jgi:hypothetical protein